MIYTITLNPALDKTYVVDELKHDSVHRAKESFEDVGGKGINVSKVLSKMDVDSEAIVVVAGYIGKKIENMLDDAHVKTKLFWAEGESRINAKIVDKTLRCNTDVNEEGPVIDSKLLSNLYDYLFQKIEPGDVVVLAGSLQNSIPVDTYAIWIDKLSEIGAKVILDTSGEAFERAVRQKPYLIKPNRFEVEEHLGRKIHNKEDIKKAALWYLDKGIEIVCISDGSHGAYFFTYDNSLYIPPVAIEVKSTVGAGDSMVAGLAIMLEHKLSLEQGAKLACALGTCAAELEGTAAPDTKQVDKMINKMQVIEFH